MAHLDPKVVKPSSKNGTNFEPLIYEMVLRDFNAHRNDTKKDLAEHRAEIRDVLEHHEDEMRKQVKDMYDYVRELEKDRVNGCEFGHKLETKIDTREDMLKGIVKSEHKDKGNSDSDGDGGIEVLFHPSTWLRLRHISIGAGIAISPALSIVAYFWARSKFG